VKRFPAAHFSTTAPSRFARVSGFFALITHQEISRT
jgi:hypothetical protein